MQMHLPFVFFHHLVVGGSWSRCGLLRSPTALVVDRNAATLKMLAALCCLAHLSYHGFGHVGRLLGQKRKRSIIVERLSRKQLVLIKVGSHLEIQLKVGELRKNICFRAPSPRLIGRQQIHLHSSLSSDGVAPLLDILFQLDLPTLVHNSSQAQLSFQTAVLLFFGVLSAILFR